MHKQRAHASAVVRALVCLRDLTYVRLHVRVCVCACACVCVCKNAYTCGGSVFAAHTSSISNQLLMEPTASASADVQRAVFVRFKSRYGSMRM